ncbi:hypothetical protein HYG81_15880 [Natrinema zhouii]|uniref:Uncharacterized protein n=1 Tax=Natrinema zhouii TaxID=1710539 RepID=A0A7D6GQX5_9EURY|nr:hypothetical protein [Natrinema zhouii]QLK25543.1 hypothetical protein HYG81_15880 [Natrinema zhouii]
MLVAKSDKLGRILSCTEIQPLNNENNHPVVTQDFRCPICEKRVIYNDTPSNRTGDYFRHADGTADCFQTNSVSDEHRVATEITLKALHNRIKEVTGEPVEIDVERWIGIRKKFVIADVRVTSPLQVAAEVYYKSGRLALGRKLNTMFANDYQAYLIFHRDGCHDVDRVERYIRRVAPLRVGRFDPETLELTLGDLFSKQQIELSSANRDQLPNYIAR